MKLPHNITRSWKYCAAVFLTSSLLFSCQRRASPEPEELTKSIGKVETAYVEGASKVEHPTNEIGTRASHEELAAVETRLTEYYNKFESRFRMAADDDSQYNGYSVGVVPDTDACPPGIEKIKFFMDDEDNGITMPNGWTGAWTVDPNRNSWHTLCRVDGRQFKYLLITPKVSDGASYLNTNYAYVRLGNNRPAYTYTTYPYTVYMDNEDKNNKNLSNAGQSENSFFIDRNTNGTSMQFWVSYADNNRPNGDPAYMTEFPDFGFNYGIFTTYKGYPVKNSGNVYIDDENNRNANSMFYTINNVNYNVTTIPGDGVNRTGISDATVFNLSQVR